VGERELCAGKLNEGKRERRGVHGERQGCQRHAGPGWVASWVEIPRHAQPLISILIVDQNPKRDEANTRLNTTSDKRNMLQHDATPMTT
jgi:hypothetical protein